MPTKIQAGQTCAGDLVRLYTGQMGRVALSQEEIEKHFNVCGRVAIRMLDGGLVINDNTAEVERP